MALTPVPRDTPRTSSLHQKPDTAHGRLLESVHISGYTFERAFGTLKWLLEDDRWMSCGDGYEDIDDFLATVDFSPFRIAAENRRELSRLLADKRASQRQIARSVGVNQATIGRDIKGDANASTASSATSQTVTRDRVSEIQGGPNDANASPIEIQPTPPVSSPPSISVSGQDAAKAAQKQLDRQYEKAKTYNHNEGDEWYTPQWLFDALGVKFDVDVCGPADRTYVATPASKYFTEADDGLAQEWAGVVWCNPPYSSPEPWVSKMIAHGNGLLLTHIPMNAEWASRVWASCDGIRLFQAIEFVRPDGSAQRPGMWLQLSAFGERCLSALQSMTVPDDVAANIRRVPSPAMIPLRAS